LENGWAVSVRPAGGALDESAGGGRWPENGYCMLCHSNVTSLFNQAVRVSRSLQTWVSPPALRATSPASGEDNWSAIRQPPVQPDHLCPFGCIHRRRCDHVCPFGCIHRRGWAYQSPLKSALRFSVKALMPSSASSDTNTLLIASRSIARPMSSGAPKPC